MIERLKQICGTQSEEFSIVKKSDDGEVEYQVDLLQDKIKFLKKTDLRRIAFIYDLQGECFMDKSGIAPPEKRDIFNTLFKKVMADLKVNKAKFLFKVE